MRMKLSIGVAGFSILVFAMTLLPGLPSSEPLDAGSIPDNRAGRLYENIRESHEEVHGDSFLAPLIAGRSHTALETYLNEANQTLRTLANFERNPSKADRRADIDFTDDDEVCDGELLETIESGQRDRFGRLTRDGRKADLPPCSADSRRTAFVTRLDELDDNAAYMANAYRQKARIFRTELRTAALLGLAAAGFGFFGWPATFTLLLFAAAVLPFAYRFLASGTTWISYLLLPVYALAGIATVVLESDDDNPPA